jgi:hypothetical protein
MFRMTLDGKTKTLGLKDPSTARTAFWLYRLYTVQGKVIDADKILSKTLAWTKGPLFGHDRYCSACCDDIRERSFHYHCFVCGNFDICSSCMVSLSASEFYRMQMHGCKT